MTAINKKLNETDRLDLNLALTTRNTALTALNGLIDANYIKNFSNMSTDQVKEYFAGICDAFIEAECTLHEFRQEFSKKYEVPYDFISRDGELFLINGDQS